MHYYYYYSALIWNCLASGSDHYRDLQLSESDAAGVTSIYYWDPTLVEGILRHYIITWCSCYFTTMAVSGEKRPAAGGLTTIPHIRSSGDENPIAMTLAYNGLLGPDTTALLSRQRMKQSGWHDMRRTFHLPYRYLILSDSNLRWFHRSRLMPGFWW